MPSLSGIRQPAVAGMFYPGDAKSLAKTVDDLLGPRASTPGTPRVRMLLSPHAGYVYSGTVAGLGFRRALDSNPSPARAFIIGPSHVEPFLFTSVYGGSAYRTPLGDVALDIVAARTLAAADPSIQLSRAGHDVRGHERGEHGIEVQIPFLQRAFTSVSIVPIVMGSQSWEACETLGGAIAAVADWDHDVVIASSDLSHFHDDRRARRLDRTFCDTLMTLDARSLHDRVIKGECEACGAGPVVAALLATESLRNRAVELVATSNSGDVNQDRTSVVGYAAAAVTGDPA